MQVLFTTEEKTPAAELAEYCVAKLHLELCRVPIKLPPPTLSITEKQQKDWQQRPLADGVVYVVWERLTVGGFYRGTYMNGLVLGSDWLMRRYLYFDKARSKSIQMQSSRTDRRSCGLAEQAVSMLP